MAAIFVPFLYSSKGAAYGMDSKRGTFLGIYGFLFIAWIVLLIGTIGQRGLAIIGWICYVAYALHTAFVRHSIRSKRVCFVSALASNEQSASVLVTCSCSSAAPEAVCAGVHGSHGLLVTCCQSHISVEILTNVSCCRTSTETCSVTFSSASSSILWPQSRCTTRRWPLTRRLSLRVVSISKTRREPSCRAVVRKAALHAGHPRDN